MTKRREREITKSSTIGRQDENHTFCFFRRRAISLFAALAVSAGLSLTSAVAATVQNIFVVVRSGTVYMFTGNGTKSTFVSGLGEPYGVVCDSAGNVYVSLWGVGGSGHGSVYKYTPVGVQSTVISGLNDPGYMAFDSSSNLFISDYGDGKIYKVTPGGAQSVFATGFYFPTGLAFDSSGDLFVADGNGNLNEFANTGGTLSTSSTVFASGLPGSGNENIATFKLTFDSAGDLFVGDPNTGNVYTFANNSGTLSTSITTFGFAPLAYGLAFDSVGDLFLGAGNGFVYEYANNSAGTLSAESYDFCLRTIWQCFGFGLTASVVQRPRDCAKFIRSRAERRDLHVYPKRDKKHLRVRAR